MNKVIDFDLFMREHDRATMDVVVFGETYTVPCEIPALVPIMMARAEESDSDVDSTRMIMKSADALFGKENVDKMCAKGLTAREIALLVGKVFSAINGTDEEEDAQELDDESGRKQVGSKAKK